MKKNYGFTLAEVLITLTIIGVIAAITIPTLMKKYQNHSNYTALKKTYSILSNAYKLVERDYGRYTDWPYKKDTNMPAIFAERMEEHLKIQKKCAGNGCFNYKVYGLNPKQETSLIGYGANSANSTSYILTDGTVLYFSPDGATNSSLQGLDRNDDNSSTAIFVDVNGKKGPNQFGRDIFVFGIAKEGWWNSTYGIKLSLPDTLILLKITAQLFATLKSLPVGHIPDLL